MKTPSKNGSDLESKLWKLFLCEAKEQTTAQWENNLNLEKKDVTLY